LRCQAPIAQNNPPISALSASGHDPNRWDHEIPTDGSALATARGGERRKSKMAKLIPVARLAKLRRNKPICAEHRGVPYCVVKTKDGEIRSFVTVCTHKDLAMFPPDARNGKLICPFHDAAFDATTGKLSKSSRKKAKRLPKVEVEIIDGVIHIKARKKHRKLIPKSERKWVEKEGRKSRL